MKKTLLFAPLFLLLIACSTDKSKFDFKDYKWKAGQAVKLEFSADKPQKVFLNIRSYYGFPITEIPLHFEVEDENGQKIEFDKSAFFREENMDCTGDFCDQRFCILKLDTLKSEGDFKLTISQGLKNITYLGLMDMQVTTE